MKTKKDMGATINTLQQVYPLAKHFIGNACTIIYSCNLDKAMNMCQEGVTNLLELKSRFSVLISNMEKKYEVK